MVRLVHIFTFRAFPQLASGVALTEAYDFGRFAPHLRDRPDDAVRVVPLGSLPEVRVATASSTLTPLDIDAALWCDGLSQAQLHVAYDLPEADPQEIAHHLATFCHERASLSFDGVPLVEWVTQRADLPRAPKLDQDVLQFVEFAQVTELLSTPAGPSPEAIAMIYRTATGLGSSAPVRTPTELNRIEGTFAAHGRGVVVLGGQSAAVTTTVRLTACELLFAVGRARHARATIEDLLRGSRSHGDAARIWDDAASLSQVAREVRQQRTVLALDVQAFADGLFMPELVIDSFRASFADALRLNELTESTITLVDALTDIIRSSLADLQLRAARITDKRERRWQLTVGMASGITIPVALLLSYFGVSSEETVPSARSIFDLTVYGVIWAAAIMAASLIAFMSLRKYVRTRNEG